MTAQTYEEFTEAYIRRYGAALAATECAPYCRDIAHRLRVAAATASPEEAEVILQRADQMDPDLRVEVSDAAAG